MNLKYFLPCILIFCINTKTYSQDNTVPPRPDSGVYFISRNKIIDSTNYKLYDGIRPYDKKDIKDSTIIINSIGEGWLDKDSLPVGQWSFFAVNKSNKPYLFKTGEYKKTEEQMFAFTDDEKLHIMEYGTMPEALQKDFCRTICFY